MSDLAASLKGLTAREGVIDAVYRAAAAIDRNDEALMRSAVTSDVNMVLRDRTITGRETLIEQLVRPFTRLDTTHTFSTLRVAIGQDGTTAKLTGNSVSMHVPAGEGLKPDHMFYQTGALIDIDLVKEEDGVWRMSRWAVTSKWCHGDREGILAHAYQR